MEFFIELREALGLSAEILPVYLEEISSTLAGTAYKLTKEPVTSAELVAAGFQAIETGMTEGHPCFVANNGRLGFGVDEYRAYAPEAASEIRLVWLAARRDRATFTAGAGLDYSTLIDGELSEATRARFAATMTGLGLDLDDYLLIPVHPWQWWNKLAVTFAGELAQRHLVCLGRATTATSPSSRSARSSTPATLTSTTSKRRCPSSTWASCAGSPPRTWKRRPRSTTGSPD